MSKTETQSEALNAERRLFITAVANLELRKKFGDEGFRLDLERDELEALIEMAERVSRLDAENNSMRAAERTLRRMGYQDRGGQEWAPPIGKAPDFDLIDSLRSRIEALDAENKAMRARLEEQAFVPPGFALVPVEPTKEMVAAACRDHGYPGGSRSAYVLGYRSMLAAAPQAAAKTGDAA